MNTGTYQTVGTPYTGFLMFGRKSCGSDFLTATQDGRLSFDIYAATGIYTVDSTYYRDDASYSSVTIQFTKNEAGNF